METAESKYKNDINYRIKQAFNIYYTKTEKCLKPRPVIISEILDNINMIKYDRKMHNLDKIADSLLDAKFKFITKNKNSCSFSRSSEGAPDTRLDVFFYKKRDDVDNLNSDVNIHSISKFLLFTNQGKKLSISIPILNFDIELSNKNIHSFLESQSECTAFLKKIKKGDLGNIISFQLSEYFFKTSSLKDIIEGLDENQLKAVIFQMASFLSYLQNKYPEVKLNNDIDDFFVYTKKPSDRTFNYFIKNVHYSIPDSGIQIRINNFMNTHINNDIKNNSISAAKRKADNSADILNFLNILESNSKGNNKKVVKSFQSVIKKKKLSPLEFIGSFSDWIIEKESEENNKYDAETTEVSEGGGTEFFKDISSESQNYIINSQLRGNKEGKEDDSSSSELPTLSNNESRSSESNTTTLENNTPNRQRNIRQRNIRQRNITDRPSLDTTSSKKKHNPKRKSNLKNKSVDLMDEEISDTTDYSDSDLDLMDEEISDNTDYTDLDTDSDLNIIEEIEKEEYEKDEDISGRVILKSTNYTYEGKRQLHTGLTEDSISSYIENKRSQLPVNKNIRSNNNKIGSLLGATDQDMISRGVTQNKQNVNNDSRISNFLGTQTELPRQGLTTYDQMYNSGNIQSGPLSNYSDAGRMGQMNSMPQMNNMSQMNSMPQMNNMPQMNSMPQMNNMPQMNGMPQMNNMPQMNSMGEMNSMGQMNSMSRMNNMSQMNSMGEMNNMPQMNSMGEMNNMPQINSMGEMNSMGQMNSMGEINNPYSPTLNEINQPYSPRINTNNVFSPNQVLTPTNSIQNVDGLDNLPPSMRQHALSGLNNMNGQSNTFLTNNQDNMQNMQYNNLPTMNEIQNQQMGNLNMMPNMNNNQPMINTNNANNILGNLPEGYSGNIPLELTSNLPMIGGGQKKKIKNKKNEQGYKQPNQQGGSGRIIPKYMDEKNTPFRDGERKKLETQHYNEAQMAKPQGTPPQSLVEFKISDAVLQQNPQNQKVSRMIYPSPYIPIQQPFPENYPYVTGQPNNMYPYMFQPNNVPYIKNYNVSLSNPAGDHIKISDLYEDMLPGKNYKNTSTTLGERLVMTNYVRSVLVRTNDGEDIDINGKIKNKINKKNLFSYLKLLELNPYHDDQLSGNPYASLPDKMVIYRSCYPIRMDQASNRITCSKTSIGLNVRIYDMTVGEINAGKLGEDLNKKDFDLWRELAYYEYIREEIIKKDVCPNFPMLYAYFISSETGINFNKLRQIKSEHGKDISKTQIDQAKDLNQRYKSAISNQLGLDGTVPLSMEPGFYTLLGVNESASIIELRRALRKQIVKVDEDRNNDVINDEDRKKKLKNLLNVYLAVVDNHKMNPVDNYGIKRNRNSLNINIDARDPLNMKIQDINMKVEGENGKLTNANINFSSGKCLLALTEAPHYNLLQWASRAYQAHPLGPVKKMINTGYHEPNVWYGVIFQIMAALHTMYKHKLAIRNMKLRDNIYIKDLLTNDQTSGFWKYKIGKFEYYIPNSGYLVMIDTNYKDLEDSGRTVNPVNPTDTHNYKMFGRMVGEFDETLDATIPDPRSDDIKKVDSIQFDNLKSILSSNNFTKEFTNDGGINPGRKVMDLIGNIYTQINSKTGVNQNGDLEKIIAETMKMFLHNRIGTPLSEDELKNIDQKGSLSSFEEGKLYAAKLRDNVYTWVMCKDDQDSSLGSVNVKCFSRKDYKANGDIIDVVQPSSNLKEYISLNEIKQKYKPNEAKLTEDALLETYII